jgi:hypothetical protein
LTLRQRVTVLETERNTAHAPIPWRFTSQRACDAAQPLSGLLK